MFQKETCGGLSISSYHEAQVESLTMVSKVPETLQPSSRKHHREVVLVGTPEEFLVCYVGVGVCQGPAKNRSPKHKNKKHAGNSQHVGKNGNFPHWKVQIECECGSVDRLQMINCHQTLASVSGKTGLPSQVESALIERNTCTCCRRTGRRNKSKVRPRKHN